MGRKKAVRKCKQCGAAENISRRGLCYKCGSKRIMNSINALRKREGPIYEKWKESAMSSLTGEDFSFPPKGKYHDKKG